MAICPFSLPSFFKKDKDDKDKEKDTSSSDRKSTRKFPWVAAGGLLLVALLGITLIWLAISFIIKFSSVFFFLLSLPFRGVIFFLSYLVKFIFYFFYLVPPLAFSSRYTPATTGLVNCSNPMALQPWEVLNFVPGPDGNPKPIKYDLNSPTPHALSIIDIDYRDTRLDIFANEQYQGSTSDFSMDKSVFCGEDLNECIKKGFSAGTVIIPAGRKRIEITWSGKDVFPGTDKIVWGTERKRRVMWKKDLCL